MLPAKRGEVGEQGIWNQVAAAAGGIQCPAEIDGVPQHDGGCDQGQTAGTVLLTLGGAVVQPAKTVEAYGARQRVVAFTLVQLRRSLPAQVGLLQPVQGVEGPLNGPDLAQRQRQTVLPGGRRRVA